MRLNELKKLCEKYKIKPTPTKHRKNPDRYEVSIDDCIKAIRKEVMRIAKEKNLFDNNLEFILQMESPMLALLVSKQDKKTTNEIWDDNNTNWVFEEKLDGIRCFLSYNHITNVYHLYSRALDEKTLLPIDYSNKIKFTSNKIPFDFILDGELMFSGNIGHIKMEEILTDIYKEINKYKPKIVVFDMVRLGDNSLINMPLSFRRREAFKVVNYLRENGFSNIERIGEKPLSMTKEEYYSALVHNGYEGVIAKDLSSFYDIKGQRTGSWTKLKKRKYEGLGSIIDDTYDLFISGAVFSDNYVNGLILSSYKVDENDNYLYDKFGNRKTVELGVIYDLLPEQKYNLTMFVNNKPQLNTNFLYKVIEVNTSGYDSATRKFNNIQFVCWRLDKSYESCKIREQNLV